MKLMEKLRQKKLGNKGFSLVELIITIAIMAILLGIVGTQVIPYLRRAREQRDMELLSAVSTAAVTAYSTHADDFGDVNFTTYLFDEGTVNSPGTDAADLNTHIQEFLSYNGVTTGSNPIVGAMASAKGQSVDRITVSFYFTAIGGYSANTVVVKAYNGTTQVLEDVISQL